jgi:hypothetical protein
MLVKRQSTVSARIKNVIRIENSQGRGLHLSRKLNSVFNKQSGIYGLILHTLGFPKCKYFQSDAEKIVCKLKN